MLWEIEILPHQADPETRRVNQEVALLTHSPSANPVALASRGFLVEGTLSAEDANRLARDLLVDSLVEAGRVGSLNAHSSATHDGKNLDAFATVLLRPGVMDPVAQSVDGAARDLGIPLASVRTFRRYYAISAVQKGAAHEVNGTANGPLTLCAAPLDDATRTLLFRKVLGNDAIEQVIAGPLSLSHLTLGSEYRFQKITVPIRGLDDAGLVHLSKTGQLSLNLAELHAIQNYFRELGRDPSDVEFETIAQTWSEHCSHKTLKGKIDFTMTDAAGRTSSQRIDNLLKETIFGATQELRKRFGNDDWCVSVFEDNAGVVKFDDKHNVCFKVETHNHPSAIEPYGGANTGIGGVIRDPLGTGMGAKPIANSDVFCFASPETPPEELPPGTLHPKKVMQGVVSGVRDYGNRMGIPTINGAVCFDPRYLGNPLVFCGTVGVLPSDKCFKAAKPGDLIVALGGRTGRDGIHGATFSSIELTSESEKVSGGAVQIGNAITEKKLLDVLLAARDLNLYNAVTDCGAGGFSSAVGEMGEKIGAVVHLDKAPLKYQGLSYTEIWISEAQERMVLAVPPTNWETFRDLCASEDVEATVLGTFEATDMLQLFFENQEVANLSMRFLHDGRPDIVRQASWSPPSPGMRYSESLGSPAQPLDALVKSILGSLNVCSKEWIIRQYDHEVQGGSVIKPLVGAQSDGPGNASVITPVYGSWAGLAVGCGINPHYGDLDPYHMACLAIDEAVRNVVAVGADPARIALLDNFCWGNTDRPEILGSLVRAAQACHDVALAFQMPFISGKDSLNNEFRHANKLIVIPPTLLISAMGKVPDVRRCVTMDLKEPGNTLILVGATKAELAGSHYHLVTGQSGGQVPQVDLAAAPRIFAKVHEAIAKGYVRSCHDLSEGGLAVAIAEMAFAGNIGADITNLKFGGSLTEVELLFSESPTRFLLEVTPSKIGPVQALMGEVPLATIGQTVKEKRLRIAGANGEWLLWSPLDQLKEAWQKPLRW